MPLTEELLISYFKLNTFICDIFPTSSRDHYNTAMLTISKVLELTKISHVSGYLHTRFLDSLLGTNLCFLSHMQAELFRLKYHLLTGVFLDHLNFPMSPHTGNPVSL